MFDKLTELISQGEYNEALYEFQEEFFHIDERTPKEAAKLCILEATLWEVLSDYPAEYDAIARGLSYNPGDYELFYMLGIYYMNVNINKAYLCMEMALFYCDDEADREVIADTVSELRCSPQVRVRNVSIMILSYNDLEIMKECIRSIEEFTPTGTYEVVVVDNASTEDGVLEFLRGHRDEVDYPFILIENSDNLGFPRGCNIGAAACRSDNDIFFLNNDAVLMQNSLFFLRMGLYDSRDVGAAGAFSNSASLQEIDAKELMEYADTEDRAAFEDEEPWHLKLGFKKALEVFKKYSGINGIPMRNEFIERFRLTGFALLLSRDAVGAVSADGQVFDESFSPAYFEDDDLGIRLARAGFHQYLCRNSFIYHNGGNGSFGASKGMEEGRERFRDKWGFDIWGYCLPWFEAADAVVELAEENKGYLRVLDFTCGFGATASYIRSRCPSVFIAGVCRTSFEAGIAGLSADEVVFGELNTVKLPWSTHSFDVVLAETVFVNKIRIADYLREGGIHIGNDQEEAL